ncbi:histidine kinase [Ramlibacter aquaticus]|uniref:Histidine kinase n=1 Tax=Ramlibacter aquaticus TaxID=2780094 RepID=A0ABR9S9F8_9BURK|nr:histidine kinase [Ramlibacter aquaticus]
MAPVDWIARLRHGLQTLAFCLAIATLQQAFQPDRAYGRTLVYSVLIGMSIWAIIDLGRSFFPSAAETGWPRGVWGLGLVGAGIVGGWGLGNGIGNRLCELWQLLPAGAPVDPDADLRSSVLITVLGGIAGSYYFYSANRSAYLERKMGEARRLADEARLKLLESQLEPHMLFNTLANLRALIAVDAPRAQAMLDHMIAFLRSTLDGSRSATHALEAEFARTADYLALIAVRMGPRLATSLTLPSELAAVPVPALLLQPVVENSIRHGVEPQVGGGRIEVSARAEDGMLVLAVADDGVGPGEAAPGFGTAQVRERLQALYGGAARYDFSARPGGGALTEIRIPLAP